MHTLCNELVLTFLLLFVQTVINSARGNEKSQMNTTGTAFGPMSKAVQAQPGLKRCQSNAQPFTSARTANALEPVVEDSGADTKDDGGLIKMKKIELNEVEEKSTGSSHEATSDDLNEKEPIKGKAHKRNQSVSDLFKERLVGYRKQVSRGMTFSDQLDLRNPQMVAEFATDIYNTMRKQEVKFAVEAGYLSKVQLPTEVKDTSRAFLVEWIIDVHRKFRLLPETLYVTVFLIDRFLSLKQIKKSQLHILGVTALLISTKYEEIYPPDLKDLLSVSENKFSRAEVLAMEQDMLKTLSFDITAPTAYRFLERFRKLSSVANDDKIFFFAQYL